MAKPLFSNLIENSIAYKSLCGDLLLDKVSHAYLFVSQDRLQLESLSRLFCAKALILDGDRADVVYNNKHADVIIVPGYYADKERKETVYTADIDALISTVHIRPTIGERKFYIIDFGETMNDSCQNKLLKTLEEPPKSTHIIINTSSKAVLLPTVSSRCKVVEPQAYSESQIRAELEKIFPRSDKLDFAASASRGNLELAYRAVADKKYAQVFDTTIAALLGLTNSTSVLACGAKIIGYKEHLSEILGFFEIIFRDIVVKNSGQNELLMLKCNQNDIDTLAKMFSLDAALGIMPLILKAQRRIKSNGNINSIVDELLFGMAEKKRLYTK